MVDRNDVFAAIEGERVYQESRWNASTTTSEGPHSLEDWVLYMQDYLHEMQHILSRGARHTVYPEALHLMRKITALGVAAMEEHGAPRR